MGTLNIINLLENIRSSKGTAFECDDSAVLAEYQKNEGDTSPLALKALSVFGGLLAVCAFMAFLFILGVYYSNLGMLLLGIGLMAAAFALNKKHDTLIVDTLCVSLYVLGFILLVVGLLLFNVNEDRVSLLVILIALSSLFITQNYIISAISILTVGANILLLIISNDFYDAVHGYTLLYTCMLVYCFLNESKVMTMHHKLSRLCGPLRIGLVFSFLLGLVPFGMYSTFPISQDFIWISSLIIILATLYVIGHILKTLKVGSKKTRGWIYSLSALTLLPALFAPAICGTLLIILLTFWVNYKAGLVIGIIALICFVIQFYYDLDLTLLTKSILLFSSGMVFILFYLFLTKKTQSP